MASSNTIYFNIKDATQFYNPLSGVGANGAYYMIAARSLPWDDDLTVPSVEKTTYLTDYQIFDEMIFGKRILPEDVTLMINRNDWISGTVYSKYDHEDPDLYSKKFFVVTFEAGGYHVFKCLDNNGGVPSTVSPKFTETAVDENQYFTADGYQWKYMYTITADNFQKFTTNEYIPVTINANVVSAAANGALDVIVLDNRGQNYYSYTSGHFNSVYVDGNTQMFALSGSGNLKLTLSAANGSYQISEFVTQATTGASGYVRASNSSVLELRNVNGQFVANLEIVGFTTNSHSTPAEILDLDLSSNNEFYTGSSIYIKSGTGAGGVRKISKYVVSGTQRIVTTMSPFDEDVDLTSEYEIGPTVNIQGDGTGAIAISTVNTSTYGIQSVKIVSPGENYSYANVTITGNTGTIVQANTAVARAIIPPPKGHGADPNAELNANKVGISVKFANTDPLPTVGTYRRVAVLKEPHYSNVVINTANSIGVPANNQTVFQEKSDTSLVTGKVVLANSTSIRLTDVDGLFINTVPVKWGNTGTASIVNVVGQSLTFDNRIIIGADYQSGSANLITNDQLFQFDTSNNIVAFGYVHSTEGTGNTITINMTNVKGTFEPSTNVENKYIQTSSADKVLKISNVSTQPLIPYTGDVIYIENGSFITRSNTQSETIRLAIDFY